MLMRVYFVDILVDEKRRKCRYCQP